MGDPSDRGFSDGVFAIAITLLVLDIKIEPAQFDHLWRALGEEWPSYLAYVTSFLTVGGVWLAHHGLFSRLQAVDPVLMRLNRFCSWRWRPALPDGAMAGALQGSESAERAAVVVYGATAVRIEVLGAAAWRYAASRPGLLADHAAPLPETAQRRRGTLRSGLYGLAIFVGIIVLPKLAAFGYFLVAALAVLSARGEGRLTLRGAPG